MGTKVYASGMNYGAVTPSDTTALDFQAIYVGVGGSVIVSSSDSTAAVTFLGVPTGSILPIKGKRIMVASTATNMVWLNW